jgi:hypothetical protein
MSIQITIPVKTIYYTDDQYIKWIEGRRDSCIDPYCKMLPPNYGFGESILGRHFEAQGYKWIHHDFNVFGGNKPGKYPVAEEVIINCVGEEKFNIARTIFKAFKPIEEPDLLIYKPDYSEIRFAESKRVDTRDKLRENQVRGLAILAMLLKCEVDVFEIVKYGVPHESKLIYFEF